MAKKGDIIKIICKKNFNKSGEPFVEGELYTCVYIFNWAVHVILEKDNFNVSLYFKEVELFFYFYTEREYRKLKLERLNEI